MNKLVLDPNEFRILDGLRFNPRKSFQGRVRGERLTKKKGLSIEFDDYREYAEGDDLRHLDWNVLARLEHPVVKTYRDEEDLAIHLLLDNSSSMSFGEPSKLDYAKRLACAMGFVALCGGDAVYPRTLGSRQQPIGVLRGRSSFPRLAHWSLESKPEGKLPLSKEMKVFVAGGARPGLAMILSDCMDPDFLTGLRMLAGRGHEVHVMQVLSEIELRPDLEGDLRLIDVENESAVEITANSLTIRDYISKLTSHNESIAEECRRLGGRYTLIESGTPLEDIVRDILRREGWVAA